MKQHEFENGYFDNSIDENEITANTSDFIKQHKADINKVAEKVANEWDMKLPIYTSTFFNIGYKSGYGEYIDKFGIHLKDDEDDSVLLMITMNPDTFEIIEVNNISLNAVYQQTEKENGD